MSSIAKLGRQEGKRSADKKRREKHGASTSP